MKNIDELQKELEIYKEILSNVFSCELNMNDTFFWACADSEDIDNDDIEALMPLFHKYSVSDVLVAYVSVKRGYESEHQTIREKAKPILPEIKALADTGEILYEQFSDKKRQEEEKLIFDGQYIKYDNPLTKRIVINRLKHILLNGEFYRYTVRAKLPDGTFAIGYNRHQAKERLIAKYKKSVPKKMLIKNKSTLERIFKWFGGK